MFPELTIPLSWALFLCVAAFLAGLIDAVVGGGGLVQIPAMFTAMPTTSAATLLGTNKLSSIWGTSLAAMRYARLGRIEWGAALPGAMAAFVASFMGAVVVTQVPTDLLRKALPFVLLLIAIYTFNKKDFGTHHAPVRRGGWTFSLAVLIGGTIGFYDGFFGPGTGSFLVFIYVRWFGFDFLRASAAAKIVNVACNAAALLWFGASGHLLVVLGLLMAVFNMGGAWIGSRLALQHGSRFVRKLFLVVVTLLIVKTGYDAYVLV